MFSFLEIFKLHSEVEILQSASANLDRDMQDIQFSLQNISSVFFTQQMPIDMTRSCGGINRGWMKVTELDMRRTTTQCPHDLELRTTPLRTCIAVDSDHATCSSNKFSVNGVQYS